MSERGVDLECNDLNKPLENIYTNAYLGFCKLKNIPPEIFELTNLKRLHLSWNKIREVPDDIKKLSNLEWLILTRNKGLTSLPESIGRLVNLKYLLLNDCNLEKLPNSIGTLSNLRYLNITNNPLLTELPESMQLLNLEIFEYDENKIKKLPDGFHAAEIINPYKYKKNTFQEVEMEDFSSRKPSHQHPGRLGSFPILESSGGRSQRTRRRRTRTRRLSRRRRHRRI